MRDSKGGTTPAAPWQAVKPGNADESVSSNTLAINVPIDGNIIDALSISPNPFTPNSDGINDTAEISLELFKLTASRELNIRIYSLDGRQIWSNTKTVLSGKTSVRWNGTNNKGEIVPPGLYIFQIQLNADDENSNSSRSQIIAVAY